MIGRTSQAREGGSFASEPARLRMTSKTTGGAAIQFRSVVDSEKAERYRAAGWWGDETVADLVERNAREQPAGAAFISPDHRMTWADYHRVSTRLALTLMASGFDPGERVAVLL